MDNLKEISIRLVLKMAWRLRVHLFIIIGALVMLLNGFLFLFLPREYTATTSIMNVVEGGGITGNVFQLIGLAKSYNENFFKYKGIIHSRTFQEQVVENLGPDFFRPKEGWNKSQEELKAYGLNLLSDSISFKVDPDQSNVLKLQVTMRDPAMAPIVANQILASLQEYISKNSLTQAKRLLHYVEDNIIETKAAIFETAKLMANFYKKYSVSPQKSMVEHPLREELLQLNTKNIEEILADPLLRKSYGVLAEKKEQLLKRLEAIKEIPEQSYFDYLQEEYNILKEVNLTLRQQYELAKLEAIKQEPAFQILDGAKGAAYTGPNQRRIFLGSLILSFLVAACYIFFRIFHDVAEENPLSLREKAIAETFS